MVADNTAPMTKKEMMEIMELAGMGEYLTADKKKAAALAEMLLQGAAVVQEQLEPELYAKYLDAITSKTSPASLEHARARSIADAKRITGNMTQSELSKINNQIAKGLEAGLHPHRVASGLSEVRGLDAARAARYRKTIEYLESSGLTDDAQLKKRAEQEFKRLLRDRRRVIARTEMRDAQGTARMFEAKRRGSKFKLWNTAGDDLVSEHCEDNEAAGAIPMDEAFPSGDMRPPAHPNCRCNASFYSDEGDAKESAELKPARVGA